MRPLYFIFSLALVCLSACDTSDTSANSSSTTTPGTTGQQNALTDNLKQRFPLAQEIEWDTLVDGYVASFTNNNAPSEVFYDKKSAFVYSGTFIDQNQLPAGAQNYLNTNYKPDFVNACMQVDFPDKKAYNVEVMTDTDYVNLQFDLKGKLVQKTKEPLTNEEMQAREEEGVDDGK